VTSLIFQLARTWQERYGGLCIALLILGLWIGGLIIEFSLDLAHLPYPLLGAILLIQTFLHTGLFITAHDAIHGTVFPDNRQLNDGIGTAALLSYALLSYRHLVVKHRQHHTAPATFQDPDFHRGETSIARWFFHFMQGYMQGRQGWVVMLGINHIFWVLILVLHVPFLNLLLFWGIPLMVSPLQLFFFGTYLPHRKTAQDYPDRHRARSSGYPVLLSFLSCYHFGYHWEHHEYPHLPWYKLPQARHPSVQ
jgi:beta-carotene/zeaxanthin 4-ketolase